MFQLLRNNKVDILRYLPRFLAKDDQFNDVGNVASKQHELQRQTVSDILRQFFVESATWGLTDWERLLNIAKKNDDSLEDRRNRILLKLQGWKTSTNTVMNELINRYTTDGSGKIIEYSRQNRIDLYVNADGTTNWHELIDAVDLYKPAHLALYVCMVIILDMSIRHLSNSIQFVTANQRIWNLGSAKSTYWNGEFNFDSTIRYDGIFPDAAYRERQYHQVSIVNSGSVQHNNNIHHYERNASIVRTLLPVAIEHNQQGVAKQSAKQTVKVSNTAHESSIITVAQSSNGQTLNIINSTWLLDGTHLLADYGTNNHQVNHYAIVSELKNGIIQEEENL